MGAGAYVCGEETALIESLEGHRGEPRNRPPFPVDTGFMGQPTVVNNVETLAWVAAILAKGAAWFKAIGTEKSAGFKLFSVSGDCDAPGVYEFPLGITVARTAREGRRRRTPRPCRSAARPGTACRRSEFGRTHRLRGRRRPAARSSSSGRAATCSHVAKNFMEFFVEESCGQCTPCRAGNASCSRASRCSSAARARRPTCSELLALGETMQLASKCGLGQSSPNAFLSIVKHFQDEILGRTPRPAH